MSHISSQYVKSSKEIKVETQESTIEKCIYELHDGTYICIESTKVAEKRDDGTYYDWKDKVTSCKSYLCDSEGEASKPKEDLMSILDKFEKTLG